MLFSNQQTYDRNQEILDKLKKRVKKSHDFTYERVTKDFDGVKDFKLAQFVNTKFLEYGFSYPTTNSKIVRCVGEEKALQTLNLYGGNNYQQAYLNMFRRQYDRSQHRILEENLLDGELYKAKQDKNIAYEMVLQKHRDSLQKDLGFKKDKDKNGNPWSRKINKKKDGKNDLSDDDDDDDNDDDK